jgi:hypothetical protein
MAAERNGSGEEWENRELREKGAVAWSRSRKDPKLLPEPEQIYEVSAPAPDSGSYSSSILNHNSYGIE